MKKNIAVYTCIMGNCSQITPIKHHENNIDYYCFTNNEKIKVDGWKCIYVDNENLSDKLLLEKYKIFAFSKIEEKYDIAIYIDNNIEINVSFNEIIKKHCDFLKKDIFFLPNVEEKCAYEYANKYMKLNLENTIIIRNQLEFYLHERFPKDYGQVSTSFIIRKTNNFQLGKMQQKWYEQVSTFSENDQISIMYCLWKNKISYDVLNLDDNQISINVPSVNETKEQIHCIFGSGLTNTLGLQEEANKYEPSKENYICKIDDINDSHSSIARKVRNGSKVLDVGCGVGLIGQLLYENKNCINYGIEIDYESCKIAQNSGYYKDVYNISIEDEEEYQKLINKKICFDYIILADVLEHTKDPCNVLEKLASLLTKNGKILISIPNVAYIDIIRALIDREFNYQKTGILDSTHFRFFTKKSFAEMIDNFNLLHDVKFDVEWFDSTKVSTGYSDDLLGMILNMDGESTVVQNIFELSKISSSEIPINLINILKKNDKSNYFTIENTLIENKKTVDCLETQLLNRNKQIEQNEDKIYELNNALVEKKKIIDQLEMQLLDKNKQVDTILLDVEKLKIDNQLLNQQIDHSKEEEETLSRKIEKLNLDNSLLNNEIKKVLESKSWKITTPLRKMMNILRKIVKPKSKN